MVFHFPDLPSHSPDEVKDQAVKYLKKKLYFMLLQLFRISSVCMCTHTWSEVMVVGMCVYGSACLYVCKEE